MNAEITKDSKVESTLDMREHNYEQKKKKKKQKVCHSSNFNHLHLLVKDLKIVLQRQF